MPTPQPDGFKVLCDRLDDVNDTLHAHATSVDHSLAAVRTSIESGFAAAAKSRSDLFDKVEHRATLAEERIGVLEREVSAAQASVSTVLHILVGGWVVVIGCVGLLVAWFKR